MEAVFIKGKEMMQVGEQVTYLSENDINDYVLQSTPILATYKDKHILQPNEMLFTLGSSCMYGDLKLTMDYFIDPMEGVEQYTMLISTDTDRGFHINSIGFSWYDEYGNMLGNDYQEHDFNVSSESGGVIWLQNYIPMSNPYYIAIDSIDYEEIPEYEPGTQDLILEEGYSIENNNLRFTVNIQDEDTIAIFMQPVVDKTLIRITDSSYSCLRLLDKYGNLVSSESFGVETYRYDQSISMTIQKSRYPKPFKYINTRLISEQFYIEEYNPETCLTLEAGSVIKRNNFEFEITEVVYENYTTQVRGLVRNAYNIPILTPSEFKLQVYDEDGLEKVPLTLYIGRNYFANKGDSAQFGCAYGDVIAGLWGKFNEYNSLRGSDSLIPVANSHMIYTTPEGIDLDITLTDVSVTNGISRLVGTITNTGDTDIEVPGQYILTIWKSNGQLLTRLPAYIGETLRAKETKRFDTSVDRNILDEDAYMIWFEVPERSE